jgi:DNA-directed RNA polymerase sigma subunit (sigma70/sigma32)
MIDYTDYKKIIIKLSRQWSLKTNFSQEELFSEGNLIFVKCCKSFNFKKAKFSTYLYLCITGHYKNMIRLENKVYKNKTISIATCDEIKEGKTNPISNAITSGYFCIPKTNTTPENDIEKQDTYNKLSNEAKEVIDIILNGPSDVINILTSPVTKVFQKRKIQSFMKQHFGKKIAKRVGVELTTFVKSFKE